MIEKKSVLFSIGHSNKSIEDFIAKLKEYEITDLIDARTYPTSKYNPQYKKEPFKYKIEQAGIRYHWRGRNIGGMAGNVLFEETIEKILKATTNKGRKLCLVCSEGIPEECHRKNTIEPVVEKLDGKMEHIRWLSKAESVKIEEQMNQSTLL